MLNYIFLFLISIGILVALGNDVKDISSNRYHNGDVIPATLVPTSLTVGAFEAGKTYPCVINVTPSDLSQHYGITAVAPLVQHGTLTAGAAGTGVVRITMDDQTPVVWKDIFTATKGTDNLQAKVVFDGTVGNSFGVHLTFEPVRFVKMTSVTNDGVVKSAKTAVELAIGLIGIMALWLGLMKIAEQSGLIAALARALKPITTRIFPDVPADHPAMGAMIMNISANMLGLSNAATPFGLKAMEELNKLNPKAGTATDAMCTFLVINTGNVQLIPATVVAIRAASGSSNPTEILGPVIVATACSLIIGLVVVMLLAKLPVYRKQLTEIA